MTRDRGGSEVDVASARHESPGEPARADAALNAFYGALAIELAEEVTPEFAAAADRVIMRLWIDGYGIRPNWQPIKTAPKDGSLIMICWKGGPYPIISRWLENRQGWTHGFNKPILPPTHWLPLPNGPE